MLNLIQSGCIQIILRFSIGSGWVLNNTWVLARSECVQRILSFSQEWLGSNGTCFVIQDSSLSNRTWLVVQELDESVIRWTSIKKIVQSLFPLIYYITCYSSCVN